MVKFFYSCSNLLESAMKELWMEDRCTCEESTPVCCKVGCGKGARSGKSSWAEVADWD